jgi:hypothetical protein
MTRLRIGGDLPGQEPRRRYLEDLLARKCEKRHFRQKNGNDNHGCAVKHESWEGEKEKRDRKGSSGAIAKGL